MGRWLMALLLVMLTSLAARAAEAYACYTPTDSTLTFYYDNYRSSRPGTTYDLNTGSNDPGWLVDPEDGTSPVTKVVFDISFASARPTTTYCWFYDMENLQSITGMSYLNTSEVTNMTWMFGNCTELTSLDLTHFNTTKVTEMGAMFYCCSSLTSLDLSSFSTSQVTRMPSMFYRCTNLRTVYVGNGWSTAAVTYSANMFSGCTRLVGGQGTTWSSFNPTDKTYAHIDGGTSNPGYFTRDPNAPEAYACYTSSNTTLTFYYDSQRSSRPGTTYDLNTGSNDPGWLVDPEEGTSPVTKVVFNSSFASARPTTTSSWFYGMVNLQSITGMSYLNTSEVTDMGFMFTYCANLTSLDLSSFNTSQVTDMTGMFCYCCSLTSLDLSSFNTSQVIDMYYMFGGSNNLRTVYVGNGWSTAAVTNSDDMFYGCTSLVGGRGTTYSDSNPTDKTYAHIDGGPSNPGYFTDINGPRPYACYTPSNTTLTFYYDNQRSSRPGTTYDLNTGENNPSWYTDGTYANVTKVVFDSSFADARPTTTYSWFYRMVNLQTITGMSYLNTSEVTNMFSMFYVCRGLISIDVSHFNTSKVTSMAQMFGECSSLTSLDLSSFNTSQVTEIYWMFINCSNLRTIYAGNDWTTDAVTYTSYMFTNCTSLVGGQGTTYDENHVDDSYAHIDGGPSNPGYFTEFKEAYACYTSSNTTLTFYYDSRRSSRPGTTYDLNTGSNRPGWDTDGTKSYVTKVVFDPSFADARPTSTYDWFFAMSELESFTGMSYLNTSEVINMDFMFCSSIKLTNLDLSSFNTAKVTDMGYMFQNCHSLISIDLSSFNTSQVIDMYYMFGGSNNLRTIYVGNGWSTAAVMYSNNMFYGCTSLVGGQGTTYNASNPMDKTYAHIDGGPSNPGYFSEKPKEAYACYTSSNTTLTFYYDNQRSSRSGTTYDLNTGTYVTGWETDGTNANVTKVVFDPSFADARPTTTYDWFYEMANLQSITGMSYLNTSEVTHMGWMFGNCTKLTSLDVSHFNTSQVVSMKGMFQQCSSLTSLDLSSFNTSKVTIMHSMFNKCSNLRTVYVGNGWTTAAVTSSNNMFSDCTRLVGGQGTTYNSNHVNKTYAHIDGGPSNPGYFTAKNAGLRGDVNGDGHVDINDVTTLIDVVLGKDVEYNASAADCNQDSSVNISDVTALIDYLLSGHW